MSATEPTTYSVMCDLYRRGMLDDKRARLFAVWCTRKCQHLMTDLRSVDALDVAERYANGEKSDEQLHEAWESAAKAVHFGDEKTYAQFQAARAAWHCCDSNPFAGDCSIQGLRYSVDCVQWSVREALAANDESCEWSPCCSQPECAEEIARIDAEQLAQLKLMFEKELSCGD